MLPVCAALLLAAAPAPALAQDEPDWIECAQYAREHSAIRLWGDAATWWSQADGRYLRQTRPRLGAVLLLYHYSATGSGHAAIVTRIVSPREIRIDHADWLHDGAIYRNDPVADVSPANDWSQVRVLNLQTGAWGSKIYPVRGFLAVLEMAADQDDRNPPPGSASALSEEDREIPSRLAGE